MRDHLPMARPPNPQPLHLNLHADVGVHGASGLLLPLRGRAAGLVALAALQPGIRRQQAALLLWPEADTPRNNLRQQLLRFRQALGRPLVEGEDSLALAGGVVLAPAACGTELLAGEEAAGDDFGHWLQAQRERERAARRQTLGAALAQAEAAGELDALLHHARAWLALEAHSEAAHAAVMQAHYLRGEAAQGLAVFRQLEDQLRTHRAGASTAPTAATRQLAQALVGSGPAGTLSAPALAPPALLPVTLKRPPLWAGRAAEQAAVQQAWALGQAVLVEGEAGLGKSRLLAEVTGTPAGAQAGLLAGSGRPGDRGAPYATLARLLRELLARDGAGLPAEARQALRQMAPTGGAPAAEPLRQGALQSAVAELLRLQAVSTLVLDDLHFADDATLELLCGLAAAPDTPVQRWLFAQRAAEASDAALALRDGLLELQRLAIVVLAPLDAAAAAELVNSLALPGVQGQAIAAALVRHTGGNPLFLLETLKQGLGDGSIARGELPRPASVGALIERRLQRLGEAAQALARVAAIAGTDFGIELAEEVIGMRAVHLAGAWAELEAAQVFRDQGFAHDLVFEAARKSTPAALARHLHGAVAGFLVQHGGAAARIAGHWLQAGQPLQALPWLHGAAVQAAAALRRREELAFLEQAAAIEEGSELPAAFDTLIDIWDTYDTADRTAFDGSLLDRIDRAAAFGGASAARSAVAHRVRSHTLLRQGRLAEAVQVGELGLALAERTAAWRTQAEIAQGVAAAWHALGEPERGLDLLRRLLPNVERIEGAPGAKGTYCLDLAAMLSAMDRQAEAAAYQDRGVALSLQDGNVEHAAMGRTNQGFALLCVGRAEDALDKLRDAQKLLASSDASAGAGLSLALHLGRALRELGQYEEALRATDRAVAAVTAQLPYLRPLAFGQQGLTWLRLGQTARAQNALDQARAETVVAPWMNASLKILEARIATALGRDAAPAIKAGLALAPQGQRRLLRYMLLAESTRLRDADHHTLAEAEQAAQEAERLGLASAELALFAMAAPLALRLGEPARATAHAQRAAALAERLHPFDLYRPEVWLHIAQTLHATDGEGQAQHRTTAVTALTAAAHWVAAAARLHVPAPFVESFLHRNPINATLLSLLRQQPALAAIVAPVLLLACP